MRNYQLENDGVKYTKTHPYKNHSKTQYTETAHGSFECNRTLAKILGWLWKRHGVRVLKSNEPIIH